MTPDEQAWLDRVEQCVARLEAEAPRTQQIRAFPMDDVAIAVMRQLARDRVDLPFSDAQVRDALIAVISRNCRSQPVFQSS